MKNTLKGTHSEKKSPAKSWTPIAYDVYIRKARELSTHSIKGVNSNAQGGGLRVQGQRNLDMPYACVRFTPSAVALDYIKGGAGSSPVTEQILAVAQDRLDLYKDPDADDVRFVREDVLPILLEPGSDVQDVVSIRLKQLLVEREDGKTISISPIPSSGFSHRLHELVQREAQRLVDAVEPGTSMPAWFDQVSMKYGGDKMQNVGRMMLMGSMQRAFKFGFPERVDLSVSRAFRLHYKGISMLPPVSLLREYDDWLSQLRKAGGGVIERTMERMDKERAYIHRMLNIVQSRARAARQHLEGFVPGMLPSLLSPQLPLSMRGLVDETLRDDTWHRIFARDFTQRLVNAKGRNRDNVLLISSDSASELEPYVLEFFA